MNPKSSWQAIKTKPPGAAEPRAVGWPARPAGHSVKPAAESSNRGGTIHQKAKCATVQLYQVCMGRTDGQLCNKNPAQYSCTDGILGKLWLVRKNIVHGRQRAARKFWNYLPFTFFVLPVSDFSIILQLGFCGFNGSGSKAFLGCHIV